MFDLVIEQYGLPVKCRTCGKKGLVKPRTDYGGWFRWKVLREPSRWYCPTHGMLGMPMKEAHDTILTTPTSQPEVEIDVEAELYKLLD